MEAGKYIYTPRFCNVKIRVIYDSKEEARKDEFIEPTHYHKEGYTVLGKHTGFNQMIFAAVKE